MLTSFIILIVALIAFVLYINNKKDIHDLRPPRLEDVEQEDEISDDK